MRWFPAGMSVSLRRWIVFNIVGGFGFLVQLTMLAWLVSGCGVSTLPATALAVETAVIHNFLWHERWTWVDRTESAWLGRLQRFLRFNLTNGGISIVGNLILMWLFMSLLSVHYLAANTMAIVACAMLNFIVSDRLVFRGKQLTAGQPRSARE